MSGLSTDILLLNKLFLNTHRIKFNNSYINFSITIFKTSLFHAFFPTIIIIKAYYIKLAAQSPLHQRPLNHYLYANNFWRMIYKELHFAFFSYSFHYFLFSVSRCIAHVGRLREPSVTTLRSLFSGEFWRYMCVDWRTSTSHFTSTKWKFYIFYFLEWDRTHNPLTRLRATTGLSQLV